ncbi:PC4-domain-containing protein [Coniochaeta ligniaria NRRL 30616]|uniref:PC4-domain-containing protein n=1 Tax=Coniochaeta ligniaria NRRL 30616 TaxID=1408157 RepID=A0A1J7JME7_9PEZI|nr:PC4-domain-containing protein [Coniochaeta ligniaria NRRL 30616]
MPKVSKKRAHTPEDDNSAEERSLKPSKKAKGDKSGKTTDAEGPFWELSSKRRVNVTKFNKALLVNIREYYEAGGELKPGKKGISLSVEQYKEFLKAIPAINEQLRKEGHDVDDVGESESAEEQEKPKAKKTTKESSRKANIEATSDEESD